MLIPLFIFALCSTVFAQELLIPSSHFIKNGAIFSNDNTTLTGTGFFPVSYSEAGYLFPDKDSVNSKNWFYRKLFKEHFFQRKNNNFILALDPLLNINIGKEILQETPDYLYQNTRGVQALGQLKDKISFYTAFYENQARFIAYQNAYFADRGELYPNKDGTYSKQNATIPMGGRTKIFKTTGFDYASAVSYIRFSPVKKLSFQFGNLPRFFGWGYRSMLLSDNSFNYTHLAIDWKISEKWAYSLIRGNQLNLLRKKYTKFVESPYERKGIGIHYLTFKPLPSLSLSIFETTVYLRDIADNYQRINPFFYNPIIGLNTIANGGEASDLKNIIGLNFAWKPHSQHLIYSQFITDDIKKIREHGFQIGYKIGQPFNFKNLFLLAEWNQATTYLFAAQNERMAYTHFNLPSAHPLGNGFKELVLRGDLLINRFFVSGAIIHYKANQSIENKTALFMAIDETNPPVFNEAIVTNINFELGYEFNPVTKLQLFVSANYRTSDIKTGENINYGAVFIGIRTALSNTNFDF